jgi:nitronate monooxygenase
MTAATELLGIDVPIVLAPMGGGPSTVELAAAVSNSGGLGSLAGGYLEPDELRRQVQALKSATDKPFAVNLFIPNRQIELAAIEETITLLAPLRAELGLAPRPDVSTWAPDFDKQLEVLVAERVPVFSFAFGALTETESDALQSSGALLVGTATNIAEAKALESSGCDLVCAQGAEAGGHHGSWLAPAEHSLIGTMALVPQVCDAIDVPVIAAGGIVDGRGVAAALCLGAGAAQMGTAFMFCPEAGTPLPHREAMTAATEVDIAVTSRVTGRMARGIRNRLMTLLENDPVPPYPVMNKLTSELRRAAARAGRPDLMSLWCGQAVTLARPHDGGTTSPSAQDVLHSILGGVRQALAELEGVADGL